VASAFISYAHEDQEFMLALVEQLQEQGLEIRYDQVVLNIGDSLIQKISLEIADGDFLVAIISPDSVESGWCQRELSLAASQGINEKRVKVLPVRFRDAAMPLMLGDIYWADADRANVETVARQLAAAIRANLEGRDDDAAREAGEAEPAEGRPAHAEVAGDVGVAQIEAVAQRGWDVFAAWDGVWHGGNVQDLVDPQRRLRWALEALPERVRLALPVVERLAGSEWQAFFADAEPIEIEDEVRDELRSARTRVAQGLPVAARWSVVADLGQVSAGRRDASAHRWEIERGEESRCVEIFISGTAEASSDQGLPAEVVEAKKTRGRSVLRTLVGLDDPPEQVSVTTAGISLTMPD
jgi:hypothetical protein